tara:strand:- start:1190 stop:1441 length:252 start_codon:yes stop_codon:yes gene_type:complete
VDGVCAMSLNRTFSIFTNIIQKAKKKKSSVNQAGNYTKPAMRKRQFAAIKAGSKGGAPGQWSARKAQLLAQRYKKAGGGYRKK